MDKEMTVAGASPSRALVRAVIEDADFDAGRALSRHGAQNVGKAREELADGMRPLATLEPKLNGSLCSQVVDHLRVIGMKVRPEMSGQQAGDWCRALLVAFSDLPFGVVVKAAAEAVHVPFRFPNEVEAKVRELAEERLARMRKAMVRLDAMLAEMHRATNRQPRLEDHWTEKGQALTDAEVHELQKTDTGGFVIRMGLKLGYILPEQLDPNTPLEGRKDQ